MGFGKERNKLRDMIPSWHCIGYYGYGHGRGLREVGDKVLAERSVCRDICPQKEACQKQHFARMDQLFPDVSVIVRAAVRIAKSKGRSNEEIPRIVVEALLFYEKKGIPGIAKLRAQLERFRVGGMTDHFVCGQFLNIHDGINCLVPGTTRPDVISDVAPVITDEQIAKTEV